MKNYTVTPVGGNNYRVTCGNRSETVDLDGFDVVTNEDFLRIEEAGLDNDVIIAPMHSGGDDFWVAAAEYACNYSGFDVDEYIRDNQVKK